MPSLCKSQYLLKPGGILCFKAIFVSFGVLRKSYFSAPGGRVITEVPYRTDFIQYYVLREIIFVTNNFDLKKRG